MLTNFANSSVIKRLTNELQMIENTDNLQIISVNTTKETISIKINDTNFSTNNVYTFLINQNYPFSQPAVYINDKSYIQYMKIFSLQTLKMIKDIWGYDCLCCNTYVCSNTWTPITKIINIIEEIQRYRNIRQAIIYKLLCDKISTKYLLKDIQLENWLYIY